MKKLLIFALLAVIASMAFAPVANAVPRPTPITPPDPPTNPPPPIQSAK